MIACIDSLIDAGIADANRVYLYGHSYGGIVVNRLARRGVGRAAVGHEPAVDRTLDYLGRGGNPISHEMLGGHPWEQPDRYERQSDLRHAAQFVTPLLLAFGDEWPTEGIALHTVLQARGHDVELVIYADEGHYLSRSENRADLERRALDWFQRH